VASDGPPGRGRLVAIDMWSGATIRSVSFDGVLDALLLGAGPDPIAWLYAVVARLEVDEEATLPRRRYRYAAHGWRLWALDPTALVLLDELPLPAPLLGLAVAPDGDHAYALVGPVDWLQDRALLCLDLESGASAMLGRVPGTYGDSLVVSHDRIYVPNPETHDVWVGDRQGRPLITFAVGEHPLDVVLSSPQ